MSEWITIFLAIIGSGSLTALVTNLLARRKYAAEIETIRSQKEVNEANEANTFAEAIQKLTANNSNLQASNQLLYQNNVVLEKAIADSDRNSLHLAQRLQDRDIQIKTLDEQLRLLQSKDKQSEITKALVGQQQAIIQIAESYQQIIADRERTIKELVARTGPLQPEKK